MIPPVMALNRSSIFKKGQVAFVIGQSNHHDDPFACMDLSFEMLVKVSRIIVG